MSNFKVELRWVLNTESTQFFCVTLCAPRAREHVHMPFYEATCQNLLLGTLPTLEQIQSQITMVSKLRIG